MHISGKLLSTNPYKNVLGEFDKSKFFHINWGLVICLFLLCGIGLINLYSASGIRNEEGIEYAQYFQRQAIWSAFGLGVMIFVLLVDYHKLDRIAIAFYIFVLILLLLVPIIGKTVNGAQRWIDIGFMNLQPSEYAKLSVMLLVAKYLSKDGSSLSWIRLCKAMSLGLLPFGLIVIQPDLGTALMLLLVSGGMVLYHGIKWHVLRVCLILIPLALPFAWFMLHDYQKQRILTFLDPSQDPRGAGYHIIQSQIAIGSGELMGKGFQEGTQSQLRFLPEKHTDFAIAVFGEEWGFVGTLTILSLFCLFLYCIFTTIRDANDRFGSTLCAGIFFYFFWQILINIGMVIGIMPVVGMPLPFISYGGSAMLLNAMLIGVVLNVSIKRYTFKG